LIHEFAAWAGLPLTQDVIAGLQAGWTFHPYEQDGEIRAIAAMSGTEIHFAIAPAWRHRVIARHRTRAFLAPLMAVHGFLTTRTEPDPKQHRFLERIGFVLTWNCGRYNRYILTALPFEGN